MKAIMKKMDMMSIVPYLGLAIVIIVFYFTSGGRLFSAYNIKILIQQTVALEIVCLGAVFIYSLGNMDISIGACVGLCALIIVVITDRIGSLLLAFAVALVLCLIFGFINGAVSGWLSLPSVVTSLFLMFFGGGAQAIITIQTNTMTSSYDFSFFKEIWVQVGTLVLLTAIAVYLFHYTKLGKYTSAIGANKICAEQCGVNVFKYRIYAYFILGICIAIASVFVVARSGSASRVTGEGFHMDVMVALILGGMPLSGGMKSRVSAAVIGAFTYVLLTNGLTLTGVAVSYVPLLKSLIFAVIVILTCRKKGQLLPR